MKKTLSVILAAAIMLTLIVFVPTTAEAKKSGDYVYTVTDGKAEITSYLGSESELVIPSDFDGVPVTSIGKGAFADNQSLTSVIIPDSVESIGGSAFSGCIYLERITIPDSVIKIGSGAFDVTAWYNNQPEGIVYSGKVAYRVKDECPVEVKLKEGTKSISDYAFAYCNDLTSVIIPDSIINIGEWAFAGCKSLESAIIGRSVASIDIYAFWNCVSLENVTIPDSVTRIYDCAFSGCVSLESATILNPDAEISRGVFENCNALTLYGYRNSTAESYANSYNIPFVPLGGEPATEPTTQAITETTTQEPTVAPTTEPTAKPILGDIDGDGKVTINDATLIQKYIAEYELPYPIGEPIQ